ncbi:MAG: hypothetical protein ACOYM3_19810, partial [Terrimicrobiaceae bacterium]
TTSSPRLTTQVTIKLPTELMSSGDTKNMIDLVERHTGYRVTVDVISGCRASETMKACFIASKKAESLKALGQSEFLFE